MSEERDIALAELASVGLKGRVEQTNGGHYRVSWAGPASVCRFVIVAKTGSDWRGRHNIRALVRRILRQDGMFSASQEGMLAKALQVPKPILSVQEQLLDLRGELADISELLFLLLEQTKPKERKMRGASATEELLSAFASDRPYSANELKLHFPALRLGSISQRLNRLREAGKIERVARGLYRKIEGNLP